MNPCSRRSFLGAGAAMLGGLTADKALAWWDARKTTSSLPADIRGKIFRNDAPDTPWKWSRNAFHYRKQGDGRVICGICPHRCQLAPGDRGVCRSRVNIGGELVSLTYGNPCAVHADDPVEKKPLFHFLPGSTVFSLATSGCNFRCLNCQNWEISQAKPHEVRHRELFPAAAVAAARHADARSIAYTYSESIAFFEYMLDIAALARGAGIRNLWISNGYVNRKPLLELCRLIDGANINLKAFSDSVYRKLNGGTLQPVLQTFQTLHAQGIHFEITNLVVPGYADDPDMVKRMCAWIMENLGPDYPLHLIRFFPRYQLNRLPPTPVSTLIRFREVAMDAGIRYVYVGNVPNIPESNTYCHACRRLVIRRQGYRIVDFHLQGNRCRFCGTVIPGRWWPAGEGPGGGETAGLAERKTEDRIDRQ